MQKYGLSLILLIAFAVSAAALGLTLVWINIERVDTAYELKQLQDKLASSTAHVSKLATEHEKMLSPYTLRKRAKEFGLAPAHAGQIRKIDNDFQ